MKTKKEYRVENVEKNNNSIDRKKHMSKEQIWDLLAPLKKVHWYDRSRLKTVKTYSEWCTLYKALAAVGLVRSDDRYPVRYDLDKLILEKDFFEAGSIVDPDLGVWQLTRCKLQAFTYRKNRLIENASHFLTNPDAGQYDFKIDHMFVVEASPEGDYWSSHVVGYVFASDQSEATVAANMLYTPFLAPVGYKVVSTSRSDHRCLPVIDNEKDSFFKKMSQALSEIEKKRSALALRKLETEKSINELDQIKICINLNTCAYAGDNIDVLPTE